MKKKFLAITIIMSFMLAITACKGAASQTGASDGSGADSGTDSSAESAASQSGEYDGIIASMAEATDTGDIEMTQEMYDKAFLNLGNSYRISKLLKKAAAGKDITIAYLGGSITDGSNANPKATSCYAYLSTKWWQDTFPDITVNYVNAGIGATDSYIGIHRLNDDVLSYNPDLVIVEYSVNDTKTWNKETYDSILKQTLSYESEPAVIALLLAAENSSFADIHAPVAFKYSVPIITYSALLGYKLLEWDQVGDSDGVHPLSTGHSVIANLLTTYYRQALENIYESDDSYTIPTASVTAAKYVGADLLYSSELENAVSDFTCEGFESVTGPGFMKGENTMWKTESAGTMSFTLECKSFGIIYYQMKSNDEKYADYSVYVDGELKGTMDSANATTWGNNASYLEFLSDKESATHKIEIVPAEGVSGTTFSMIGMCINK